MSRQSTDTYETDGRRSDTERNGLTLAVPRSRGAISGLVLLALGVWGFLVPIVGSHFTFGYGPAKTFDFTAARLWLQILPGVVVAVAGLMILIGGNRLTGTFWAYLAIAAGAWFIAGPVLADLHQAGYVGAPMGGNTRRHLEALMVFSGLGGLIILFAALVAGRLSVVGVRDVRVKEKRHSPPRDDDRDEAVSTTYPATREVPVTTTHVRPVESPITHGEPADAVVGEPARDAGALRESDL